MNTDIHERAPVLLMEPDENGNVSLVDFHSPEQGECVVMTSHAVSGKEIVVTRSGIGYFAVAEAEKTSLVGPDFTVSGSGDRESVPPFLIDTLIEPYRIGDEETHHGGTRSAYNIAVKRASDPKSGFTDTVNLEANLRAEAVAQSISRGEVVDLKDLYIKPIGRTFLRGFMGMETVADGEIIELETAINDALSLNLPENRQRIINGWPRFYEIVERRIHAVLGSEDDLSPFAIAVREVVTRTPAENYPNDLSEEGLGKIILHRLASIVGGLGTNDAVHGRIAMAALKNKSELIVPCLADPTNLKLWKSSADEAARIEGHVVGLNVMSLLSDVTIEREGEPRHELPAGTHVFVSLAGVLHDPDLFPDPLTAKLNRNLDTRGSRKLLYVPYGIDYDHTCSVAHLMRNQLAEWQRILWQHNPGLVLDSPDAIRYTAGLAPEPDHILVGAPSGSRN